jgi:hypothetical protein
LAFPENWQAVLDLLRNEPIVYSRLLVNRFNWTKDQARQVLSRMARKGLVEPIGRDGLRTGRYRAVTPNRMRSHDGCEWFSRDSFFAKKGPLSEYERGWLEGIIDGEGSLSLYSGRPREGRKVSWQPILRVSNTNSRLLERVVELIGFSHVIADRSPRTPNHKRTYAVVYGSSALRWLLPQLRLIAKEGQRVLLLEAVEILRKRRAKSLRRSGFGSARLTEIHACMRELNRRGTR